MSFDHERIPERVVHARGADDPKALGCAIRFIGQAFKHCKTIGVLSGAEDLVKQSTFGEAIQSPGVIYEGRTSGKEKTSVTKKSSDDKDSFLQAVRQHRHWTRDAGASSLPY